MPSKYCGPAVGADGVVYREETSEFNHSGSEYLTKEAWNPSRPNNYRFGSRQVPITTAKAMQKLACNEKAGHSSCRRRYLTSFAELDASTPPNATESHCPMVSMQHFLLLSAYSIHTDPSKGQLLSSNAGLDPFGCIAWAGAVAMEPWYLSSCLTENKSECVECLTSCRVRPCDKSR